MTNLKITKSKPQINDPIKIQSNFNIEYGIANSMLSAYYSYQNDTNDNA